MSSHTAIIARDTVQPEALRTFADVYFPKIAEFLESVGANPKAARIYYFGSGEVGAGFALDDADLPMVEPLIGDIGDPLVQLVPISDEAGENVEAGGTGVRVEEYTGDL